MDRNMLRKANAMSRRQDGGIGANGVTPPFHHLSLTVRWSLACLDGDIERAALSLYLGSGWCGEQGPRPPAAEGVPRGDGWSEDGRGASRDRTRC
jgi:hypothetical protein